MTSMLFFFNHYKKLGPIFSTIEYSFMAICSLRIMSWLWTIVIFSFIVGNIVCESMHQKKLPSVVVGTVYCDTCYQKDFSESSRFISGASVVVECKDNASSLSFRKEVKTNKHGHFQVHLPFSVNKKVKKINLCSAQLIRSNTRQCNVAGVTTSSPFNLKSRKQGRNIFSAGFLTFKPLKQPVACNRKQIMNSLINSKESITNFNDTTIFPPPILGPQPNQPTIGHFLPPLPQLPLLPPLPTLPPLPELPHLPPLLTFPFQPMPGFPGVPVPPAGTSGFPGVPLPPAGTPPASKTESP